MSFPKEKCWRSKKYTRAAEGQSCTMNSPWCTYKDEETCFRHLNESFAGKGKGLKAHDFAGFDGCQGCEDWYTEGYLHSESWMNVGSIFSQQQLKLERDWYAFRAMVRTIYRRLEQRVLKV